MSDPREPGGLTVRRRLLYAALYFSEGAPIGYIWWALPTKLRAAGVPIERVTQLTAVLILPWAFKFLWAPLIDAFPMRRLGVRGWILAAQTFMGLALIPLLFLDVQRQFAWFAAFLFLHAVAAATQDAAVDSFAIATIPPAGRGAINAWMQIGMLAGRSWFGGVALYMEQRVGQTFVLVAMLLCIWSSMVLVLLVKSPPRPEPVEEDKRRRLHRFIQVLGQVLSRKTTWMGLLFAAFGGTAYEAVGAVGGPMLIDKGAVQDSVGLFFAAPAVLCMAGGALLGGRVGDRFGRQRAVVGSMLSIAATTVLIALTFAFSASPSPLFFALGLLYLLIGAFTASSYALFMDVTDARLGATQFSALMGTTNLCEAWSSLAVGWLIGRLGYPWALCVMALPTIFATVLVRHMCGAFATADSTSSASVNRPSGA